LGGVREVSGEGCDGGAGYWEPVAWKGC
jgi:hypothetical protein